MAYGLLGLFAKLRFKAFRLMSVFLLGRTSGQSIIGQCIQSDLEKSSIMCVTFEDGAKKPLSADGLSHSPKFGDYIYLTAGAGAARGFRQPIRVPENAVRLTLAFVRWTAKGELKLSDLKVVALES